VILLIREPVRRQPEAAAQTPAEGSGWKGVAPVYVTLAAASFVDNAVGGWSPTLLIRDFAKDPAQIGLQLGALLTIGFGGGVLIGGSLADAASVNGGWRRKLQICLIVSALILPCSLLIDAPTFGLVLAGVPLYFLLSGLVTAVGFSAILDVIPGPSRGLAMAIAFFLNVALGAGLGPTAVALANTHIFGPKIGLGPPIVATAIFGYCISLAALALALRRVR
jgi:MFS family permease